MEPISWVSLGVKVLGMFGGGSEVSAAAGSADTFLNTSNSVIGGGAVGASASTLPWYVWPVGALVAIAIIKKVA